jgi:hypothetical protein
MVRPELPCTECGRWMPLAGIHLHAAVSVARPAEHVWAAPAPGGAHACLAILTEGRSPAGIRWFRSRIPALAVA